MPVATKSLPVCPRKLIVLAKVTSAEAVTVNWLKLSRF